MESRVQAKVTREVEDELLAAWWQRRALSEKALCIRYGIARSALQRAIRRARKRASVRQDLHGTSIGGY